MRNYFQENKYLWTKQIYLWTEVDIVVEVVAGSIEQWPGQRAIGNFKRKTLVVFNTVGTGFGSLSFTAWLPLLGHNSIIAHAILTL